MFCQLMQLFHLDCDVCHKICIFCFTMLLESPSFTKHGGKLGLFKNEKALPFSNTLT